MRPYIGFIGGFMVLVLVFLVMGSVVSNHSLATVTIAAIPTPPPAVCGNGVCQADEDCSSCPADCGTCPARQTQTPWIVTATPPSSMSSHPDCFWRGAGR